MDCPLKSTCTNYMMQDPISSCTLEIRHNAPVYLIPVGIQNQKNTGLNSKILKVYIYEKSLWSIQHGLRNLNFPVPIVQWSQREFYQISQILYPLFLPFVSNFVSFAIAERRFQILYVPHVLYFHLISNIFFFIQEKKREEDSSSVVRYNI